mmetsp:Transcript_31854/g.53743  ORF Transcript_31854/g.53743 Transcript_31854/m.53743 type:complete len:338 (+) Transcript_31854:173-1186(+)
MLLSLQLLPIVLILILFRPSVAFYLGGLRNTVPIARDYISSPAISPPFLRASESGSGTTQRTIFSILFCTSGESSDEDINNLISDSSQSELVSELESSSGGTDNGKSSVKDKIVDAPQLVATKVKSAWHGMIKKSKIEVAKVWTRSLLLLRLIYSRLTAWIGDVRSHIDTQRNRINEFTRKPIVVKAMSSAVGYSLGDFIAQVLTFKFKLPRILRMALFGLLVHGPLGYMFYSWLFQTLEGAEENTVLKRVFVEQVTFAPVIAAQLLVFSGIFMGKAPYQIYRSFQPHFFYLLISSWMIWPASHYVNFKRVVSKHRLLFINCVQLAAIVLQSIVIHR